MIRIMFVCHGNICRSPMAEFVFKDLVKKRGLEDLFIIASSATSTEELGNPVHHGTRNKLKEYGISTEGKRAVQLSKKDYEKYDYIIAMDGRNITNTHRIIGHDSKKIVSRFLDFTENSRDIADPWYTGDFDQTYSDIREGCESLLNHIMNQMD
jgi:protein-tyrosine phosphatase